MKKWFIWSYGRGSFEYDLLCFLILVVIILIPSRAFNDRPDYMRLNRTESIRSVLDDDGNQVYTVQLTRPSWFAGQRDEGIARLRLVEYLALEEEGPAIYRTERIYDNWSAVAAYAFWVR
jgi:hypothetical protein